MLYEPLADPAAAKGGADSKQLDKTGENNPAEI